MPSIVTEVSAIFVLKITFLVPSSTFSKAFSYFSIGKAAYN
jgi:hypothetical protein